MTQEGLFPSLRALAHQIKGAAGGYGFPSITDLAAHLEVACIDDPSRVDAAFGSLVQTCKRVRRGLRPSAALPRTA